MNEISRRHLFALGGALAATAVIPSSAAAATRDAVVPSGRADGVRTGGSRRIALTSGHEVWVKQVGTGEIPVLTLHGGPGFTHFYLECLEDFLPKDKVRFWYYDQLGCGFSDAPDDPALWTVERFRDEVEQVRAALGIDQFVLYGQSWGGMLAIEYALAYPQHVKRLVISNMTASIPSYVKYVNELHDALPADVRAAMQPFEAAGDYAAPAYQELLMTNLYAQHICRLDPWPEPALRAFRFANTQVYNTMQGPSEFVVTGNFKDWDRWADLHRITAPTLLLVGRYDTMSVTDIQRMGGLIPDARVVVCENGSHMSLYDDQVSYFNALVPFVTGSE